MKRKLRILLSVFLILACVFSSTKTIAASRKISSQKQYWQALYNFSKGASSSITLDMSSMNISNFYSFESPSNWKYGADIGYVITQDFDYKIIRNTTYSYTGFGPNGRPLGGKLSTVSLYWRTSSDRTHAKQTHAKANKIIKKIIKPGMSKSKRVKAIRTYLVKNVKYKYNTNTEYLFNSYGALVKKKAACQGISAAFNLLARKAGIPSVMATNRKENHAWNLYRIGKTYYMIDCTMPKRMGTGTKMNKLKYSMYKKFDQKIYYKKLFSYETMVKY